MERAVLELVRREAMEPEILAWMNPAPREPKGLEQAAGEHRMPAGQGRPKTRKAKREQQEPVWGKRPEPAADSREETEKEHPDRSAA